VRGRGDGHRLLIDRRSRPASGRRQRTRRRGGNLDKLTITRTVDVKIDAQSGSRNKGYEDIVVQDVILNPSVTCYRRERRQTPDGKTLVAPLDPGIIRAMGPICIACS
jgi:hypothetical protein